MAEDPLCTHEPGTFPDAKLLSITKVEYGGGDDDDGTLQWEDEARARMKRIPAFVRGMVTRSVESYCRKNEIRTVTAEVLEQIRSRMPTRKIFGGGHGA